VAVPSSRWCVLACAVACGQGRPETISLDPPAPDRTPPTAMLVEPSPFADNVWVRDPIRLTFSEPLDPKSLTEGTMTLASSEGPVGARVTLSSDGRELTAVLDAPNLRPTRLTATVASTLTDLAGNAFEGAIWSWDVPLWQRPGGAPAGEGTGSLRPALALDRAGQVVVAWQDGAGGVSTVHASRVVGGRWKALGDALGGPAFAPRIAVDRDDRPIVIWSDGARIGAKRLAGEKWNDLGLLDPSGHEATALALALDADGRPVVAWVEDRARIQVRRWDETTWQVSSPAFDPGDTVGDFDLAIDAGGVLLAATVGPPESSDVRVVRWDSSAASWRDQTVGASLRHSGVARAGAPSLAVSSAGTIAVAWQENDGHSDNVYAATLDGDAWREWSPALDIDFDASAVAPSLKLGSDGMPVVAWSEGDAPRRRSFLARRVGTRWEVLGSLDVDRAAGSASAVVALDGGSQPVVVWDEGATGGDQSRHVQAKRFNGSPELPYGLDAPPRAPCSFPRDGEPDFPRTLTQTHCFTDVLHRTPAPGLVPYDVNSPLWSDGAYKRRFIVLPEKGTVGFTERDAWQFPVGTIFVKEFLLEPGGLPMETRFLVKRCEPGACRSSWQGYSYRWNDAGTDADLLENETDSSFKDWKLGETVHKHTYPARDECNQCHALAAGGVLGFQTRQLRRNFDYGGVVDDQLRALAHAGVFGDGFALPSPDTLPRLPRPSDPAHSLTERVRSYFHANCSHCHRQDGRWPVIDFRYDVPLVAAGEPNANICNELVPGSAATSKLFVKDSVRDSNLPPGFTGRPMPPLATLVPDLRQLPVLEAWIDGMKSCP
jgi:hypothetical protein